MGTSRFHASLPLVALTLLILPAKLGGQEQAYVVRPNAAPCLNVRPSPESDATSFACIPVGTQVVAIGTAPYWRQIRLADGRLGWAAKKYLEPVAPAPAPGASETGNPAERDEAWLEVHILDVGQGDGIWIRTFDDGIQGNGRYEGRNIVIDGGPDRRKNNAD